MLKQEKTEIISMGHGTIPLVDAFGRHHTYLRIAVTDRCNLRCHYCMPVAFPHWRPREEILTFEEIVRIAGLLAAMGIRKIRLTGGEPTVREGLETLIRLLAAIPGIEVMGLTTNGVRLVEMATGLRDSGITHLNISLDTLRRERFQEITRCDNFLAVRAGIDAAMAAGFQAVKLNAVVIGGVNDDELLDYVELIRERPLTVRFIEYMPFKENGWQPGRVVTAAEMMRRIREQYPLEPVEMCADPQAVATDYRIPGLRGGISFISPLSDAFCTRCSRLRLTADGSLKTCLFKPAEVNLRETLRAGAPDDTLETLIRSALTEKPLAHPPAAELMAGNDRAMRDIGG
jgi:molybdenum cofactor biosynthesis protein A